MRDGSDLAIGAAGVYVPLATERSIQSALGVGADALRERGLDADRIAEWLKQQTETWREAFGEHLVTGYETLESSIQLSAEDDRYLVAAAIIGRADVIVTSDRGIKDDELPGQLFAQTPTISS